MMSDRSFECAYQQNGAIMKAWCDAIVGLFCMALVSVCFADQSGPYTYKVAGGRAAITAFDKNYSGPLTITNELGGVPVTRIERSAFASCPNLTSVVIPDSVTSLGSSAFSECGKLRSATIGNGVVSIETRAFFNCSLTELVLGSNVTSIGDFAFYSCRGLTSLTIPACVTSIGRFAFDACTGLTNVVIPKGVASIGNDAFHYCARLPKVSIPASVGRIDGNAFSYSLCLKEIAVETNNAKYSSVDGVLFDKTGATLLGFPGGKTGLYAIPDGVLRIGDRAFANCAGLTDVTIPEGVAYIGHGAFRDCTNLKRVLIPASVTIIGNGAFYRAVRLVGMDVATNNTKYCSLDGVLFDKDIRKLIAAPVGRAGTYVMPDTVTCIADSAFCDNVGLTNVTIGSGVTHIGDSAFANCSGLQNMYFMGVAPTFGANALVNCKGLTLRYLPAAASGWTNNAYGGRPALLWDSAVGTGDHVAPSGR
jgi:hypothetical protein